MNAKLTTALFTFLAAFAIPAIDSGAAGQTRDDGIQDAGTQDDGPRDAGVRRVGFIIDFDGFSDDYRLMRGERKVPLVLLMPLQAGDQLSVLTPAGRLSIRTDSQGRNTLILRQEDSPYTVHIEGGSWQQFDAIWNMLLEEITIERDYGLADGGVMGANDLEMPLAGLDDGAARIQAGPRRFGVGWLGGSPPYAVALADAADGRVVHEGEAETVRYVSSEPVVLEPGEYELVVRDGAGTSVAGRFAVVPPDQVPDLPGDLAVPEALTDLADVFTAAWLATRDDGIWALESYQLSAPLAADATAASALADALAKGWLPESE